MHTNSFISYFCSLYLDRKVCGHELHVNTSLHLFLRIFEVFRQGGDFFLGGGHFIIYSVDDSLLCLLPVLSFIQH